MKVVRFYAPKDVRIEDVPEPECGPDEVKLRVRNCSTCGTDVKIFNNGHQNIDPPRIMGHEISGEVVEVGANVHGWSVGDRAQVIAAVLTQLSPMPSASRPASRRARLAVGTLTVNVEASVRAPDSP